MGASPGGCWPSAAQYDLLVAAFGDADLAADAVERWWEHADLDRIDPGSFRLLPQLYRNLVHHQLSVPSPRLRDLHRQSWFRTQLQFRQMAVVLDALKRAGVETLLIKGAALAPQYFGDLGCRPMADVDIVVPRAQALTAARILEQLGWAPDRSVDEGTLQFVHAMAYRHPGGGEVDLHWRVLADAQHDEADVAFWAASRPLVVHGMASRTLDPADELLLVLAHGIQWNSVPSIRWIGDALAILDSETIDWDRLVQRSCELRLVLPVRHGMLYLRDRFRCPIPDRVVADLHEARVRWWEHVEMAAKLRPWSIPWAAPVVLIFRLFRSARGTGTVEGLKQTGAFTVWRLEVDRPRELPGALGRWFRRFRRRRRELAGPKPSQDSSAAK